MRYNIQQHPELSKLSLGMRKVTYSLHACEAAKSRGLQMFPQIHIDEGTVVEVEAEGKRLTKLVVRLHDKYSTGSDLVYVINPISWTVITCYKNKSDDNHATLDTSRVA